ncbi:MAG: hypothetical protein HY690_00375 [Chloroflexi bacterium]|nr:hypothetical protein [Chloroflexota bacterium]
MCEYGAPTVSAIASGATGGQGVPVADFDEVLAATRFLVQQPEVRRQHYGFIGYGGTRPGDRVLVAVDTQYDPVLVDALVVALRERGAKVDVLWREEEPDREFDQLDEFRVIMRREPSALNPRRYEGVPWIEELAAARGYDLLVHGKGGPTPRTPHRYEGVPWTSVEQIAAAGTYFPRAVNVLVNLKTQALIYERGRGGRVRVTDPEGTDISYTLWPEYYDGQHYGWHEDPVFGHVMAHPTTPLVRQEDATGVVAGTTSHFSRAFPRIELEIDSGRIERIKGGGHYGDAWRDIWEETRNVQYPCFPRPGLFWIWEMAIGTNVKMARPRRVERLSSGGFEAERMRSGVIHTGHGTFWRAPEETWAGERGLPYGHLHAHLLFPTLVVTTTRGEELVVVNHGRLAALDDPEVRELAAQYGDPDEVLREEWVPSIPGISAPGDYADYAADPGRFIYGAAQE